MLARWGGAGLIVATEHIRRMQLLGQTWVGALVALGVGVVLVGGLKWMSMRVTLPLARRWPGQIACILLAAGILAGIFHLASPAGLLRGGGVTSELVSGEKGP